MVVLAEIVTFFHPDCLDCAVGAGAATGGGAKATTSARSHLIRRVKLFRHGLAERDRRSHSQPPRTSHCGDEKGKSACSRTTGNSQGHTV